MCKLKHVYMCLGVFIWLEIIRRADDPSVKWARSLNARETNQIAAYTVEMPNLSSCFFLVYAHTPTRFKDRAVYYTISLATVTKHTFQT